ncbi:hypothetical protein B0O99DRAFT_276274 [Bisporella sp. PMI_857]|nr:hypothetical protein B0O99DRAFT_276274 [Bisporella sp. PMI_857]
MASIGDKINVTGTTHGIHGPSSGHTAGVPHSTHTSGAPEGTYGTHNSRTANALDPRIDSDRDGSHNVGHSTGTGVGHSTHTGTTGLGHTSGAPEGTHGTHNSRLANAADPRIDSDRDGSKTVGTAGHHGEPVHQSNLLNKADPRVSTGTHNTTTGSHGNPLTGNTGTHGGISHSTNAGPHNSNVANKLDPAVDSDLDGRGNRHTGAHTGGITGHSGSHATPGSGTAQNTAGPHNSDLLNKLDPRVDSDLSGGKTLGPDKTYT